MDERIIMRSGKLAGLALLAAAASPAHAYLFWTAPNFSAPAGTEPTLVPLEGALPKEIAANKLWSLRAGLNVAALQCQFAPALMTVRNYNDLLKQHAAEFATGYKTITGYFRRTAPKNWQTMLDQYTTRTYNGYSTLHTQLGFCEEASEIGRDAVALAKGQLTDFAAQRIAALRNSVMVAAADALAGNRTVQYAPVDPGCYDRRGRPKPCK